MASFDENGKYIKTNWKAGDKITATKLNKIEESIEAVNDNDISRHVEADTRLDALEAKDVAHDKELTNIKNTIADNKAAAELGDYDINSRMQFLEQELNEGIEEVHNVASTVDGKIATAEANMTAQVNQGKADMEAMVAEVESEMIELQNDVSKTQNDIESLTSELNELIENVEWDFVADSDSHTVFHYVLPGGLIIQGGKAMQRAGDDSVRIEYALPFTVACITTLALGQWMNTNDHYWVVGNTDRKTFVQLKKNGDANKSDEVYWLSIGY
jgi:hypothetical protein